MKKVAYVYAVDIGAPIFFKKNVDEIGEMLRMLFYVSFNMLEILPL